MRTSAHFDAKPSDLLTFMVLCLHGQRRLNLCGHFSDNG